MRDALLARCTFPPAGSTVTCAVSGGADSSALVVLATAAGLDVTAMHVDHCLRAGSGAEADVVAALAERYGAKFETRSAPVEPGPNLEARARTARWAVLPSDALTGHTADDQAETILLNLLRGAALAGLRGMRRDRHPLLGVRRSETHALCAEEGVTVVDDESNRDLSFRRNRVRAELVPLLDQIAGRDIAAVIARQAQVLGEDDDLLEELAAVLDPTDALALAAAPPPLARRALRRWLRDASADGQPPDAASLDRALAVVRGEATATELPGGVRLARTGQRLRLDRPD